MAAYIVFMREKLRDPAAFGAYMEAVPPTLEGHPVFTYDGTEEDGRQLRWFLARRRRGALAHGDARRKYERAACYPWLPLAPEPEGSERSRPGRRHRE